MSFSKYRLDSVTYNVIVRGRMIKNAFFFFFNSSSEKILSFHSFMEYVFDFAVL